MGQKPILIIVNLCDVWIVSFHPVQIGLGEEAVITRSITDISHAVESAEIQN